MNPWTAVAMRASVALLLAAASIAQINLPQNIDDSTFGPLLSGNTYVANQTVFVAGGRTLTVQPGVVVKFASNTTMQIAGTLNVNASAAQPSWFTSTRDAAVGIPIDPLPPTPGDWRRLQFVSSSTSQIRGLVVRYAGGSVTGAIQTLHANILLEEVVVTDSASDGIDVEDAAPTIRNCRFDNNLGRSIDDAPFQALPGFTNNTATGNTLGDAIRVTSGTITGAQTVSPRNLIDSTVVISANITVATGSQLTLDAGVVLKWDDDDRFVVNGTLTTNGTTTNPVVFTSIDDDSFGGDTAKDGPTVGSPGDWDGLSFSSFSDASELRGARVRYGGNGLAGAVRLLQADITLNNVIVDQSLTDGLHVGGNLPVVSGCRFDNNLGRSIDNVVINGLQNFTDNTATGNQLGNAIRCTNGDVVGARTVSTRNLIDATLVVADVLALGTVDTLTIEPGVVMKWETAQAITVAGTLTCNGTSAAPIVFTSVADDAIAGDTGNDGPTVGSPGDWTGLRFTGDNTSQLRFINVRFAGGGQQGAVRLQFQSDLLIEDSVIEHSATDGLAITNSLPRVRRCRFDDNVGRGVDGFSWRQMSLFFDNTATGNAADNHTRLVNGSTGSAGLDIRVNKWNTLNSDGVVEALQRTFLNPNAALTLGAGLIVKFANASTLSSGMRASGNARLFFDGRGHDPIVLTAVTDDQYGGDTNGDGNATAPQPGAWGQVLYSSTCGPAQMNHVLVRFGGNGSAAAVSLDCNLVSIDAVRSELSSTDGFRIGRNGGGCRNLVAFGNTGDGVVLTATDVSLIHATVAANQGRGVVTEGTHTGNVAASISWFNGVNAGDNFVGFVDPLGQPVRLFHCNGSPGHAGTQNNFVADPLFTDPNNGDLSLSLFSPCVGTAGAPNDAFTYEDHDGRSRVLDHNLFGFALPDIGAYEYAVYNATVTGTPRLGATISFRVEGQPFQGNPPGICLLFFGATFPGIGIFTPPYGNANIWQPPQPFFVVSAFLTGTEESVAMPTDPVALGISFGLQTLVLQANNVGTGNWTQPFYGTLVE